MTELTTMSDADLRAILLTCDGRGKVVKEAALGELFARRVRANAAEMDRVMHSANLASFDHWEAVQKAAASSPPQHNPS
jgi:hypothetical protein